MRHAPLLVIATLVLPVALAAQTDPKTPPAGPAPRTEPRPLVPTGTRGVFGSISIGEAAPGFELNNAGGRPVKLSRFRGNRVLLCFADQRDVLGEYRTVADSLLASGVVLVGITKDSPRSLRSLAERDSLGFELLSDPTGEISAMFGSYDFATSRIRPGYVLVGRTGLVRMVLLGQKLPADDVLRITRYALSAL